MAVVEAVEVPLGFDVIGAVKSKLYRYTIYTGPVRPVLQIRRCWHIPAKLDIAAMAAAAKLLVGTKDFKSFAAGDEKREDTVRTIFRCDVYSSCVVRDASCEEKTDFCLRRNDNTQYAIRSTQNESDWVYVDVEGNSFLWSGTLSARLSKWVSADGSRRE
jgi:tRNA pseudouridine(38-40) synthase